MLVSSTVKAWAFRFSLATALVQVVSSAVASQLNVDLPADSLIRRAGTVPPNQDCNSNSDCISGDCNTRADLLCYRLHPDGSAVEDCFGDYYPGSINYCEGYRLGHKCANQGECHDGHCSAKGYCVASYIGQACKNDLGCSGAQLCKNGKCFLPANNSIDPLQDCKRGYSCKSGRCVTSVYNMIPGYGADPRLTLPACDYFQPGQKGCKTMDDCGGYLCSNGTCILGNDGDRCIANFQCKNVCNLNGVCETPNFSKPPIGGSEIGQPCKNNTQCISNVCYNPTYAPGVTRPDFRNPGKNYTFDDGNCQGQLFGAKCFTTADCEQGACTNGTCQGTPLNSTCTADKFCASSTCVIPKGQTKGKCAVSKAYAGCSTGATCYSGGCDSKYSCPATFCPFPHCAAVDQGGKCRFDGDCFPFLSCQRGVCK
ncbi:hypothetical protein OC846_005942 [Tilletia horrida]|uniref:Dickkopf N-terminal cysteine-rich domain-containing protein n=1 Tax=Tilletia horrida TaxID=155126 RepID=A0AAN6GJV0_9BASI|nr:hypothetical protein OC846_005942 [Tilletia horrida]